MGRPLSAGDPTTARDHRRHPPHRHHRWRLRRPVSRVRARPSRHSLHGVRARLGGGRVGRQLQGQWGGPREVLSPLVRQRRVRAGPGRRARSARPDRPPCEPHRHVLREPALPPFDTARPASVRRAAPDRPRAPGHHDPPCTADHRLAAARRTDRRRMGPCAGGTARVRSRVGAAASRQVRRIRRGRLCRLALEQAQAARRIAPGRRRRGAGLPAWWIRGTGNGLGASASSRWEAKC